MNTLLLVAAILVSDAPGAPTPARPAFMLSPIVTVSDVQPVNIGAQLRVPVLDLFDATGEIAVGAGRGSQYLGEAAVGVRTQDEPVWFAADFGMALIQALTQTGSGVGRVSLVDFETDLLSQLRVRVGVQVIDRLAPFFGVSLNYQVSFGPNTKLTPSYFPIPIFLVDPAQGGGHQIWPGLLGGFVF